MDKITRVLLLYSKLIRGELVNKLNFCMETGTGTRSFDRDIEDIRLYLSDMYQVDEVLYDRENNNYYLSGIKREELEIIEYRFLEHLLMEAKVLRSDELSRLLYRLASNTKNINHYISESKQLFDEYEDMHSAALLKMHGDIEMMIRNNAVINIRYINDNQNETYVVVPCNIIYEFGHTYLVSFSEGSEDGISYYEMRKIDSFIKIRNQSIEEKKRVNRYKSDQRILLRDSQWKTEYHLKCKAEDIQNIKRKFKSADIYTDENNNSYAKVVCNEDELIGWVMGQTGRGIALISPEEAVVKLKQRIKVLNEMYKTED